MKKTLLITLFGLLTAFSVCAQDGIVAPVAEKKVAVSIVAHAGLNMSSFTGGDTGTNFGMRMGANAGAGVGLRFLKRHEYTPVDEDGILGFYGGVAFEMGGTKAASSDGISMLNIGVPLYFQVYPLSWLYIEAGPEFFFNLSNSPQTTTIGNLQVELGNGKFNDVKLGTGIGAKIGNFGIGARYLIGMTNFSSTLPWKCNIIQVNLTYSFPLNTSGSHHNNSNTIILD